jgi:hypothetical protein
MAHMCEAQNMILPGNTHNTRLRGGPSKAGGAPGTQARGRTTWHFHTCARTNDGPPRRVLGRVLGRCCGTVYARKQAGTGANTAGLAKRPEHHRHGPRQDGGHFGGQDRWGGTHADVVRRARHQLTHDIPQCCGLPGRWQAHGGGKRTTRGHWDGAGGGVGKEVPGGGHLDGVPCCHVRGAGRRLERHRQGRVGVHDRAGVTHDMAPAACSHNGAAAAGCRGAIQ